MCLHTTFNHTNAISPISKFTWTERSDIWWNRPFTLCSTKKEKSANKANKMVLLVKKFLTTLNIRYVFRKKKNSRMGFLLLGIFATPFMCVCVCAKDETISREGSMSQRLTISPPKNCYLKSKKKTHRERPSAPPFWGMTSIVCMIPFAGVLCIRCLSILLAASSYILEDASFFFVRRIIVKSQCSPLDTPAPTWGESASKN